MENYEIPFNPDGWEESSIFLPLEIMISNFDKVTIKNPDTFFIPHFKETEKIFKLKQDIPKELIALHLWESYSIPYMKKINDWNWYIENKHTLYGKMMINLLEKYILNDNNVYIIQKKNFDIKDNKFICNSKSLCRKKLLLNDILNDETLEYCNEGDIVNPLFPIIEDFYLIERESKKRNKSE